MIENFIKILSTHVGRMWGACRAHVGRMWGACGRALVKLSGAMCRALEEDYRRFYNRKKLQRKSKLKRKKKNDKM